MKSENFFENMKIYALSDSHQETRKISAFLSKILEENKNSENVLILHCGDIYKGVYPKELERDCYIEAKKLNPKMKMIMTIGNNDFGFNKENINYCIETIELFKKNGINVVCANIFDSSNNRPAWLEPYFVFECCCKKIFVTGFCIDNLNISKFGLISKKQDEVLNEIKDAILQEKPDKIIVLNHDYMDSSKKIVKKFSEKGIKIDLTIGGHDHEFVEPDEKLNIFYPQSFGESMYKFELCAKNPAEFEKIDLIKNENLELNPVFEKKLKIFEEESKLLSPIVPCVLDLEKQYSNPCSLGSFLADFMMEETKSEIAFFSTGFLMKPLKYEENKQITNYLFKKTMVAKTPVLIVELSAENLKEIFSHALKTRCFKKSNPRFLQCSNNIKIEGKNNAQKQEFELKQIFIDEIALFDENLKPKNPQKKYKTVIDSFIAKGGQGFWVFENLDKFLVLKKSQGENLIKIDEFCENDENCYLKINEVLLNALKLAPEKYPKGSKYPCFEIIEN